MRIRLHPQVVGPAQVDSDRDEQPEDEEESVLKVEAHAGVVLPFFVEQDGEEAFEKL